MLLNPPPPPPSHKQTKLWSFLLLSCFYPYACIILAGTTTMASILDQYEEESARATSLSTVTPLQVPVSSHNPGVLLCLLLWNIIVRGVGGESMFMDFMGYLYLPIYVPKNILQIDELTCIVMQQTNTDEITCATNQQNFDNQQTQQANEFVSIFKLMCLFHYYPNLILCDRDLKNRHLLGVKRSWLGKISVNYRLEMSLVKLFNFQWTWKFTGNSILVSIPVSPVFTKMICQKYTVIFVSNPLFIWY